MHYTIKCTNCKQVMDKEPAYKCLFCGGILEFEYNLESFKTSFRTCNSNSTNKYKEILPINRKEILSLGEGNTPLIKNNKTYGEGISLDNLYFKLEGLNPSGSFKDRGISVSINKALELNIKSVVIASSGNASSSTAAYCARAGIKCIGIVPESTPTNKLIQALSYGSFIVGVKGNFSNSYKVSQMVADRYNLLNLTTTFNNPYAIEGYKTIGYEIFNELGDVPEWVIVPVGAGPILASIHKSFKDMRKFGLIEKQPKLVCVQAENCGPIARAFLEGKNVVAELSPQETLASGIDDSLDGYPEDGDYTILCIKESKGTAILLKEEEIIKSNKIMAQQGIYAEPAGSVGLLATIKLVKQGLISNSDKIVIIVTGNGLKSSNKLINTEIQPYKNIEEFIDYI